MSKQITINEAQGLSDVHAARLAEWLLDNDLAFLCTTELVNAKLVRALEHSIIEYVKRVGTDDK